MALHIPSQAPQSFLQLGLSKAPLIQAKYSLEKILLFRRATYLDFHLANSFLIKKRYFSKNSRTQTPEYHK